MSKNSFEIVVGYCCLVVLKVLKFFCWENVLKYVGNY